MKGASFGTVQIIAHNSFFFSDQRPQMSDCGALDIFSKQFKMMMNFRLLKISDSNVCRWDYLTPFLAESFNFLKRYSTWRRSCHTCLDYCLVLISSELFVVFLLRIAFQLVFLFSLWPVYLSLQLVRLWNILSESFRDEI